MRALWLLGLLVLISPANADETWTNAVLLAPAAISPAAADVVPLIQGVGSSAATHQLNLSYFAPINTPTFIGPVTTTQLLNNEQSLVTTNTLAPGPAGSVGEGPLYFNTVRTGGFGQYGNALVFYEITAATPSPQIDNGITTWVTHKSLTGGAVFGYWGGANTPALYKSETYSGGSATGMEINYGNRWDDFGLQTDVGGTRWTAGINIVPDVVPASGNLNVNAVSIATGSPATFTLATNGFYNNMGVSFTGTAGLTGITDGTEYFVVTHATNTFQVAATLGGAALNITGSAGPSLAVLPAWPGSFGIVQAASIHGHQTYVQQLIRTDSIAPGGYAHLDNGGSVAGGQPGAWAKIGGHFTNGLDLTAATISSNLAVALASGQEIYLNGAIVVGASNAITLTTGTGTAVGSLQGNGFGQTSLSWNSSGTVPQIGFYGTSPQAQPAGYGTPTNVSLTTNFPGTAATLAQTGGTLAALITNLKTLGVIGN